MAVGGSVCVCVVAIRISLDDRQPRTAQGLTDPERDSRQLSSTAIPGFELIPVYNQNAMSKLQ